MCVAFYLKVYKDGELMGGLDILKEMEESGELQSMLPKKQSLNDRLKALIESSPVMIFMKGNPQTPKCGFSRTLIEIMMETQ
jgi:glutaredoxin-related protein